MSVAHAKRMWRIAATGAAVGGMAFAPSAGCEAAAPRLPRVRRAATTTTTRPTTTRPTTAGLVRAAAGGPGGVARCATRDDRAGSAPEQPSDPAAERLVRDIAGHRLVFLGEAHGTVPVVDFQRRVQAAMLATDGRTTAAVRSAGGDRGPPAARLHVVMEHFCFEHQGLLDRFLSDPSYRFEDLAAAYEASGEEGHDLAPYRGLLMDAKASGGRVRLHAGFLPRRFARMWIREGAERTREVIPRQWLPERGAVGGGEEEDAAASDDDDGGENDEGDDDGDDDEDEPSVEDVLFRGTELHFSVFESFFTGAPVFDQQGMLQYPTTGKRYRRIFRAQVLKDVAMSNKINTLLDDLGDGGGSDDGDAGCEDKVLVIAGNGHLKHYCGVPERVLWRHRHLTRKTCLVISELSSRDDHFSNDGDRTSVRKAVAHKSILNPGDYMYYYRQPEHGEQRAC